jgi:NitT/TauT family transport system substrate-binding protein
MTLSIRAAVVPVVKPLTEAARLETDAGLKKEEASMRISQSRRAFLATLSAAGAATVLGPRSLLADEGPPEVTTIRIRREPGEVKLIGGGTDAPYCAAPLYVAKALLEEEGFTDVQYPLIEGDKYTAAFESDDLDFGAMAPGGLVGRIESGVPIKVLGGIHPGCFELFVHEQIKTIEDLKGKQVGLDDSRGSASGYYVSFIAANAGLDPEKDIRWVTPEGGTDPVQLFMDGKIDAYMAFMPQAMGLHDQMAGQVLVDTAKTEPWGSTYCCHIVARNGFVDSPIATTRALRAILKATDLCANEPEKAARSLVDDGFVPDYDHAVGMLQHMRYDTWRTIDTEHSLRFYAEQMQKLGKLKTDPQTIVANGSDLRFLDQLRRELKT